MKESVSFQDSDSRTSRDRHFGQRGGTEVILPKRFSPEKDQRQPDGWRASNNMRAKRQLERWLAKEILGKDIPRKPPKSERNGPPRDHKYRAWIRSLPCAACGSTCNVEAAHTGSDGGTSIKASDYSCIPLCAVCHRTGPRAYHGLNSSAADFARRWDLDIPALVLRLSEIWRNATGSFPPTKAGMA
jgi:hypothetical protein